MSETDGLLKRKKSQVSSCFDIDVGQIRITIELAWPVMLAFMLQMSIGLVALGFVGRMGTNELAAASLGMMFANIMGFSVGIGFASALDTLCAQAYGSGNNYLLGTLCQRSILILGCISLPLGVIWWWSTPILLLLGQDSTIASLTGRYMRYQFLGLWPQFIYSSLNKYLQTQGITKPSMHVMAMVCGLNPIITYVLMYVLNLGFDGAALSISICRILQAVLLALYIQLKGLHHGTWPGWTRECLNDWGVFLKLGFPGCIMICAEWWATEILTLAAGWVGTTELAVQAVLSNANGLMFSLPLAFSIACSIRVGNNLGAGNPLLAQQSWRSALQSGTVIMTVLVFMFYITDNYWPYLLTNDKAVADLTITLFPVLGLYCIIDTMQVIAAGALRGCGHQKIGAYCNLFSYYMVGLPLSMFAAFSLQLGIYGLWLGNFTANMIQTSILVAAMWRTSWHHECELAKLRTQSVQDDRYLKSPFDILNALPPSALTPTAGKMHVEAAIVKTPVQRCMSFPRA